MTDAAPPVAIVDTSPLYSARRRRTIVDACEAGRLVAVWSPHIIGELYRVLTVAWIEKHGLSAKARRELSDSSKAMMDLLSKTFELVDTRPLPDEAAIELVDQDDHHLLRAARRAVAGFVISENTNDFPAADASGAYCVEGVEFVRDDDFFERLRIDIDA